MVVINLQIDELEPEKGPITIAHTVDGAKTAATMERIAAAKILLCLAENGFLNMEQIKAQMVKVERPRYEQEEDDEQR